MKVCKDFWFQPLAHATHSVPDFETGFLFLRMIRQDPACFHPFCCPSVDSSTSIHLYPSIDPIFHIHPSLSLFLFCPLTVFFPFHFPQYFYLLLAKPCPLLFSSLLFHADSTRQPLASSLNKLLLRSTFTNQRSFALF